MFNVVVKLSLESISSDEELNVETLKCVVLIPVVHTKAKKRFEEAINHRKEYDEEFLNKLAKSLNLDPKHIVEGEKINEKEFLVLLLSIVKNIVDDLEDEYDFEFEFEFNSRRYEIIFTYNEDVVDADEIVRYVFFFPSLYGGVLVRNLPIKFEDFQLSGKFPLSDGMILDLLNVMRNLVLSFEECRKQLNNKS